MSQQASHEVSARTQPHRNPNAPAQRTLHVVRGQNCRTASPIAAPGEDRCAQPGARAGTVLLYTMFPLALLTLLGRLVGLV